MGKHAGIFTGPVKSKVDSLGKEEDWGFRALGLQVAPRIMPLGREKRVSTLSRRRLAPNSGPQEFMWILFFGKIPLFPIFEHSSVPFLHRVKCLLLARNGMVGISARDKAKVWESTDLVTTLPAPMVAFFPMINPQHYHD
jgi:hypothetical protein